VYLFEILAFLSTAPDNLREEILKRWLEKDLSAVMAA
jgi:hypothetical protein